MGKKKLTKKEIREPDVFRRLMGFLGKKIEQNSGLVKAVGAILVISGVFITGNDFYQSSIEESAQEDYFQVEKSLIKKKSGFLNAKLQQEEAEKNKPKKNKLKKNKAEKKFVSASGDLQKDYGRELTRLEDLMKKHQGTVASQLAAINMIDLYNEYSQAGVGLKKINLFEKQKKGKGLFNGLLTAQVGNLYAQGGQCNKAIAQWQEVLNRVNWKFLQAQTRLKMGVCYESLKKFGMAKKLYEEVKGEKKDSAMSKMADKYLRTLPL